MKSRTISFPDVIGVYAFKRVLNGLPSRSHDTDFALYESALGEKAFAKRSHGASSKTMLDREIAILDVLLKVYKRVFLTLPAELQAIRLPSIRAVYREGEQTILLLSYEQGGILAAKRHREFWHYFFLVYKLEEVLGKAMTEEERQVFPKRSGFFFVWSYPVLFALAFFRQRTLRGLLLRTVPLFIKGLFSMLQETQLTLSHRDLHGKNIIKRDSGISVLDFSYGAFSIPTYDTVVTLSTLWHDTEFRTELLAYLTREHNTNGKTDAHTRYLMGYVATLFLTGNNYSTLQRENYIAMLRYAISDGTQNTPEHYSLIQKLVSIIPSYLHSSISYISGQKKIADLPHSLMGYEYVESLAEKKRYPFAVGRYINADGHSIVAKVWQGKRYSVHAFNLLHEIVVCKTLGDIRQRIAGELPEHLQHISTPGYVGKVITNDCIALLMEPARGIYVSQDDSVETMVTSYETVREYFAALTRAATDEEKALIGIKTKKYYALVYPLLFLVASIRHISYIKEIVLGMYSVWAALPHLTSEGVTITHGDLHTDNILRDGENLLVLDLEQVRITYPELDLVATLSSRRSPVEFRKVMKEKIDRFANDQVFSSRFAGIGAFVSTHNLTSNMSPIHTALYVSVLKEANQYSVEFRPSGQQKFRISNEG